MVKSNSGRMLATLAIGLMVTLAAVDIAEARRAGGGFGSRGTRTFSAPPVTRTAPAPAAPIDRTMTNQPSNQPAATRSPTAQGQPGAAARRPGLFGGFGGSMLGGLMMGGLIGMMLGQGLGGGIGFMGLLLQIALIIGAVMLFKRMFGQKRTPAYAGQTASRSPFPGQNPPAEKSPFSIPSIGGTSTVSPAPRGPKVVDDVEVGGTDLDYFEDVLKKLQAAYGQEDYAALRQLTTPEAMSYLAEELSENATQGVRNEVKDVQLVQGDVAEAWSEDGTNYATVAMRYESVDVMRDRKTGAVVSGDPSQPTESVELWTFVRKPRGEWLVSAIQGVDDKAA